jgi:hypothetical protein
LSFEILCKPKKSCGKEFFTSIYFLKKLRAGAQNCCALFFAGFYPELVEGFQLKKSKKDKSRSFFSLDRGKCV